MEREPKNIEKGGGYFTVYCLDEGRTIYSSSGINWNVERIIAEKTAFGHANDLGHKVYIFETGKLKFSTDD